MFLRTRLSHSNQKQPINCVIKNTTISKNDKSREIVEYEWQSLCANTYVSCIRFLFLLFSMPAHSPTHHPPLRLILHPVIVCFTLYFSSFSHLENIITNTNTFIFVQIKGHSIGTENIIFQILLSRRCLPSLLCVTQVCPESNSCIYCRIDERT